MYLVLRLCCTMMDIVNTRYTPPSPHWLICPHQVELYSKDKKGKKKQKKKQAVSVLPVEAFIISLSECNTISREKKLI